MIKAGTAQEETFNFGIVKGFKVGGGELLFETEGTNVIISVKDSEGNVSKVLVDWNNRILLERIKSTIGEVSENISFSVKNATRNSFPDVKEIKR